MATARMPLLICGIAMLAITPGVSHAQTRSHPAWAVGKWDEIQETPCGNYSPSTDAAGRYEGNDDAGIWWYGDRRLCFRKLIEYDYDAKRWRDAPLPPACSRIRFTAKGVEHQSGKDWYTSSRCGKPDIGPITVRAIDAAVRRRAAKHKPATRRR